MSLPVISTKKPVFLPPWKMESPPPSAENLSKKQTWTPALKPCSGPDAHSLDRSSRRRFREHQDLSAPALPACRRTDRQDNLPTRPFPENLTQTGADPATAAVHENLRLRRFPTSWSTQ